jgi:putative hydrolase of the HAD superfamily
MQASLPRPQGLLLDAMGTLIHLRDSVGVTYAQLAHNHGMAVEPDRIDRAFGQAYRSAPPLAFPGLAGDALRQAEIAWWGERIRSSLLAAGGSDPPAALIQDLFNHYAEPAAWRVYPDVAAQLERWSQRGLALAVVSNFDTRLPGLLEGLGLARWLQAIVISSNAGAAKPDPAPFQLALDQLGLAAHQAWHVGDSPEDTAGAAAAGLVCIQVQRP